MKRMRAKVFIAAGLLCLMGALGLTGYNIWDESRADEAVTTGVSQLKLAIPEKKQEEQLLVPEPEEVMTTVALDGRDYVGLLEVPSLGLELPVMRSWSESLLRYGPCLYEGNIYDGMIIAGHNYRSHFANLTNLSAGDEILFTDIDGNVWTYELTTTEVIDGYDVDGMKGGNWDLTLFTCTYGGQERVTLRCTMKIM